MIPVVGVMIGGYIVLRCIEILAKSDAQFSGKRARSVTNICAMLVIIATAVCVYDLVVAGTDAGKTLRGLQ